MRTLPGLARSQSRMGRVGDRIGRAEGRKAAFFARVTEVRSDMLVPEMFAAVVRPLELADAPAGRVIQSG
jgi:hypothetical protein